MDPVPGGDTDDATHRGRDHPSVSFQKRRAWNSDNRGI